MTIKKEDTFTTADGQTIRMDRLGPCDHPINDPPPDLGPCRHFTINRTSRKKTFNDSFVAAAGPGTYTDAKCAGLKLNVATKRRFFYQFQIPGAGDDGTRKAKKRGPVRKITVGFFPAMGVPEARGIVDDWRKSVLDGVHPTEGAGRADQRDQIGGETFGSVAKKYLATITDSTYHNRFHKYLVPALGDRPVFDIKRSEIMAVMDAARDKNAPTRDKLLIQLLKNLFRFALKVAGGDLDDNWRDPMWGIEPTYKAPVTEDRTLSRDELMAVWNATAGQGGKFEPELPGGCAAATRLLLLTGQRKHETTVARWEDFDLDAGLWTVPWRTRKNAMKHTKKGKKPKDHQVFLCAAAVDMLRELYAARRPDAGPYLFTTHLKNGASPTTLWVRFKKQLDKDSGVTNWRIHDLRHTLLSGLADLDVMPHVASLVASHTMGDGVLAVTQRYMKTTVPDAKRDAMNRWGDYLFPPDTDNVVSIQGGAS